MKVLLVAEYREGVLREPIYELVTFAKERGADVAVVALGAGPAPEIDATVYRAEDMPDYAPAAHKALILDVMEKSGADMVVFSHSSYGWDMAPRIAYALGAGQASEVVGVSGDELIVPAMNAKLRRSLASAADKTVVTVQEGAFAATEERGSANVESLSASADGGVTLTGYEVVEKGGVDLGKAEIIVTAGRGIGKADNVSVIEALAKALGGELGASRPVVDAGWVDHSRQVGTTGQTVAPKLYVACGVSGAIQHLAGMRGAEYVIAVNTDASAPIGEVADVLVVADAVKFCGALAEKIGG